jgi:hypothetical protein
MRCQKGSWLHPRNVTAQEAGIDPHRQVDSTNCLTFPALPPLWGMGCTTHILRGVVGQDYGIYGET